MNVYSLYNDNFEVYFIIAAHSEDEAKSVVIEHVKKDAYLRPCDLEYIIPEINTESSIELIKNTSCDLQEPAILLTLNL